MLTRCPELNASLSSCTWSVRARPQSCQTSAPASCGARTSESFGRHHIHVLVVFPVGTTPDVIERLFADTDLSGAAERDGSEHVRFPSLAEIRARVASANGLFVLAHID